jgi:hypothetical protein
MTEKTNHLSKGHILCIEFTNWEDENNPTGILCYFIFDHVRENGDLFCYDVDYPDSPVIFDKDVHYTIGVQS